MKETILITLIVVFIYIFIFVNKSSRTYVQPNKSIEKYLVQNDENKKDSANLLFLIITNIYKLRNHLFNNIKGFPEQKEYIIQLTENLNENRTSIYENEVGSNYTSYSVNKGEEIVFCLKSKRTKKLHNINLMMYVAIHEMAHLACPEIGHTQLFKDIFKFLVKESIKLNIYNYKDYGIKPVEYCGMKLTSNII